MDVGSFTAMLIVNIEMPLRELSRDECGNTLQWGNYVAINRPPVQDKKESLLTVGLSSEHDEWADVLSESHTPEFFRAGLHNW